MQANKHSTGRISDECLHDSKGFHALSLKHTIKSSSAYLRPNSLQVHLDTLQFNPSKN